MIACNGSTLAPGPPTHSERRFWCSIAWSESPKATETLQMSLLDSAPSRPEPKLRSSPDHLAIPSEQRYTRIKPLNHLSNNSQQPLSKSIFERQLSRHYPNGVGPSFASEHPSMAMSSIPGGIFGSCWFPVYGGSCWKGSIMWLSYSWFYHGQPLVATMLSSVRAIGHT